MKPADVLLAVLVAVIFGLALVASRQALDELSPALMTALCFAIAGAPCLFVRPPAIFRPPLIAISLTSPAGQFLAQSYGIAGAVPVGLASATGQRQAPFAALIFGERPTLRQAAGIAIATIGLLLICGTVGLDFGMSAFAALLVSPVSLAVGNLLPQQAKAVPNAHGGRRHRRDAARAPSQGHSRDRGVRAGGPCENRVSPELQML